MSTPTQPEEVADSGKDDDKNFDTPAVSDSDAKGDVLIEPVDVNLNFDVPTEIESSSTENTENFRKPLPPDEESTKKADLNTCGETCMTAAAAAVAESETIEPPSISVETGNLPSAVKDPSDIPSITKDIQRDVKNSDGSGKVIRSGYRETVIDDVSESDIELRWSDDEDDDEIAAAPLSDEALKKLDAELGIVDADSNEKIEDETLKMLDMELGIDNTNMVSPVLLAQSVPESDEDAINKEPNELVQNITDAENLEKSDDVKTDPSVLVQNITDSENQQAMANILEPVEIKTEIEDDIVVEMETNPEISEFIQDNEYDEATLENLKVEIKEENSMDIHYEAIETVPCMSNVDVVSEQIDSGKCINNDTLANIKKEIDVDDIDNISEIDIDETIVDIKRLIDQDEDTINQLGLNSTAEDVKDENEQFKTVDDDKTKSIKIELESEKSEHKVIKTSLTAPAINEDEPMDQDISMETKELDTSLNLETISKDHINKDVGLQNNVIEATSEVSENPTDEIDNRKKDAECIDENKSNNLVDVDKDVQVTNKNILLKCVEINEENSMVGIETIDNSNDPKPSGDLNFVENDDCENKDTGKRFTDAIKAKHTPDRTDFKESCMTSDVIERDDTNAEEIITPDVTNTSIKINTEHRITRPDVMLDIPTQEFDFDEFDDTTEQHESEEAATPHSDLTTQTVSEIVNRLAKENMKDDEMHIKESKLESKIKDMNVEEKHMQDENQSCIEKHFCKDLNDVDMASIEHISTTEAETDTEKVDITFDNTPATLQKIDKIIQKDIKSPENVEPVEKSKENKEKSNNTEIQPSRDTTKDADIVQITQVNNDISEAESKRKERVEKSEAKTLDSDPQPSTSEGIIEETQEAEDNLDLLAESSRVMEEDDDDEPEAEDDEADDGEVDDDDFDPEDDNSNPTGEHSEESNPTPTDVDIQEDGIDIDFNNEADKMGLDSNDATFETLGETRDKVLEETKPLTPTKATAEPKETEGETDSKDVDESSEVGSESSVQSSKPKERRNSILAGLLTRPAADMNTTKSSEVAQAMEKMLTDDVSEAGVVDLGGSSSDDDTQATKEKLPVEITLELDETGTGISADTECSEAITTEANDTEIDDIDNLKMAEVFSLDSDDDDKKEVSYIGAPREHNYCINFSCTSDDTVDYYLADRITSAYYGGARRSKRVVCKKCLDVVSARNEGLVSGIKDLRPLMALRMARPAQTLLEISDSDSEGEEEPLGEKEAGLLEGRLTDMLNKVWIKYNMEERLQATEDYLEAELEIMQKQSEEVAKLLRDCQKATDSLRTELYTSFEGPRHELPSISIHDTPIASYACLETEDEVHDSSHKDIFPIRNPKRRSTTVLDTPAKKQAGPFEDRKMRRFSAHSMADEQQQQQGEQGRYDEDKDISVVRLSAEAAPADLPPLGELVKAPLRPGMPVYAMKNQYGAWIRGRVLEVQPKQNDSQYTMCRVRFDHKVKISCKQLSARSIAYTEPSEVRMTIGTRVIALFKNSENSIKKGEFYYSGVVAEIPNPVNAYRYLVFFDDGYAQYVEHRHTRLVCESKTLVWEEVHPFSRDFVCNYLMKYPERPMVRMHPGQEVNVEWNGKWWDTKVVSVDAALVHVQFPDSRTEWIYRGSTRLKPLFNELLAAKRADRTRMQRSTKANTKANAPYVEYTRSDDQVKADTQSADDMRRQRSVAKKSTSIAQQISSAATDGVTSRVVFYTPKNSVRPLRMVPHSCGPQCKRSDLLSLKDLRTYNPLTKPLLSGWERQIVRHKASRAVMYCAPCGRRLRNMPELHRYLRAVRSDMPVDLFDFNPNTHCLAEFVLNKTNVQKKDLSHGKENVPVPCVNYYDHSLPEFCSYNTVRTPTAGVPLNLDPDFLCGCDCEDDCVDKSKCACWKMTLEGARTIGMDTPDIGYDYRRLPEPLPSGIYECNSRCKCKSTCLNRVVQNPLQLKLQVFKTLNRGWGIRALNDVPKGSFICIYAGNLLTDATANLDGLNEGDEYLAELDYIEVVEAMKEGYEDDIPEADKELDKKESKADGAPESDSTESEEEEGEDKSDTQDGDFEPGYLGQRVTEFNKRLRRRDKRKNKDSPEEEQASEEKPAKKDDDEECITISDDEEVREPSRFAAQESMTDDKIVSKYRSIRQYYGKDEACYIMDAKVQGNIGRYLNHSCSPNVFVQNVFVDTHDPRFPWVSFFALHHIRAGTELTWNYNYDIGSVPGKVLYCYCAAPNCRGRLL